jgi:hypothetical protein
MLRAKQGYVYCAVRHMTSVNTEHFKLIGIEVLTVVITKMAVFWVCSAV